MYTAKEINGSWYVLEHGTPKGDWIVGRMPRTREQCEDACRRLNAGATIRALPIYQSANMDRVVAHARGGDTYTAQDAENGCIPSEASFVFEEE